MSQLNKTLKNLQPKKKPKSKINLFKIIVLILTFIALLFIGLVVFAIIFKGLPHFSDSFKSQETLFAIKLSLYTTSISSVICMLFAIPTAYALTRFNMPFKKLWQIIVEIPLSIPYLVLGLSLLLIFSSPWGKALKEAGFQVVFNRNGIIIAQIIVNLPYAIRFIRVAFEEIDTRLEFIAQTLGASMWQCFRTITLPLAKNSIISAFILTWSRGLGEFGATLMLVGATRMKTETLPTSIYLNMATGETGPAMASAVILILISCLTLFITSFLNRKAKNLSRV